MNVREKIKSVLEQRGHSIYWLAHNADSANIVSASSVYKYMAGEIDLVGEKRDQLLGLMSKRLQMPLVLGYALDGDMLFKTNVPLITLMENNF